MNENLLTNPVPEDFNNEQENNTQPTAENPKEQLALDIDDRSIRLQQVMSSTKMNLKRRSDMLEVSMLWKLPALPFAVTSLVFIALTLVIGGIVEFNNIPPQVPFFYDSIEKKWGQVDKTIIFIFPILLILAELLIIQFSMKIFKDDRRLSMTINWILTLLNFLILIIITQIYSLIT